MKRFQKFIGMSAIILVIVCGQISTTLASDEYTTKDLNEQLVMSVLWVQTSAEFRALCYQAFNLAKMNLDAFMSTYNGSKPVAISVDVDETLIDNSVYEAFLIGKDFLNPRR